jgi:hypothetical protein
MKTHPTTQRGADTFTPVKRAAQQNIRWVLKKLLPNGRDMRSHWLANVPWRDDKKASLVVYYNSGTFVDLGEGHKGGILDLAMRLYGTDAKGARDALAALLGIDPSAHVPRPPSPPKCNGCAWYWLRYPMDVWDAECCTGSNEPSPIAFARQPGRACGPRAALFVAQK